MYFLLCYDINFYLFEGMSQQLNLNSGYYANNGKGRSHPYHCTPLYRQYSDAMMSTPSTGQKTNLAGQRDTFDTPCQGRNGRIDRAGGPRRDGEQTCSIVRAPKCDTHSFHLRRLGGRLRRELRRNQRLNGDDAVLPSAAKCVPSISLHLILPLQSFIVTFPAKT